MAANKILVVDDEAPVAQSIREILEYGDFVVDCAHTIEEAESHLMHGLYDAAVVDLCVGETSGLDVLRRLREIDPAIAALMLTAYGTTASVSEAFRLGVKDFLEKPVGHDELLRAVSRALELSTAVREIRNLRLRSEDPDSFDAVIGKSAAMLRVVEIARRVAPSDLPVVIQGETGTGKGVLAGAIHAASQRANGPFVTAVIAATTSELQKGSMFGYVRGAFTGAATSHRGFFQQADNGTLFLDEIGEVSEEVQVALLRATESGVIRPAGSEQEIAVDVRIIAATNRDLNEQVKEGRFREDLLFRLGGVVIEMPPLRERKVDIVPLAEYFLQQYSGPNVEPPQLDEDVRKLLVTYRWPGNIRELKNVVERASVLCDGQVIRPADCLLVPPTGDSEEFESLCELTLDEATKRFTRRYFEHALERYSGNKEQVAEHAGVHVTSIRRKMRQLGIDTTNRQ